MLQTFPSQHCSFHFKLISINNFYGVKFCLFVQSVYLVSSAKGWELISHNIWSLPFIAFLYIILASAIPEHVDIKHGEI